MGRLFISGYASYPFFYFGYRSRNLNFDAELQISGDMYAIECPARGFAVYWQPGDYWKGLAAMERFIIDTTLDPMAVIMFRAERRLEHHSHQWDLRLNRLHRRAAEKNATIELEAGVVAFALHKGSYEYALRIHNNLIKLYEQ